MTRKAAAALVSVLVIAFAFTASADERMDARRGPVVRAVENASGAVINISTEKVVRRNLFGGEGPFADPFFEHFMDQFGGTQVVNSLGSGGIFTTDGYIFTNAHVLDRASKVTVTLSDGAQYPADLVSVDVATDLAVIKIKTEKPLPALTFGRSDDLLVGEQAIAVGNPFGLSNTVTTGVISAIHRDVTVQGEVLYKDFLQTDALINPGNSGGPLLNVFGEVIGVNTAMRADAQGIGFAIPVDRVKRSLAALLDYQRLRRIRLGLDLEERYTGSGPETTLLVKGVENGGPADLAGVKAGDRVTAVGGRGVDSLLGFNAAILSGGGGTLQIALDRSGQGRTAAVAPYEIPRPDGVKLASEMFGLTVKSVSGGSDGDRIVVLAVATGSSAAQIGMEPGDVILQVNGVLASDMDAFASVLESSSDAPSVDMVIVRRQGRVMRSFLARVPVGAFERS